MGLGVLEINSDRVTDPDLADGKEPIRPTLSSLRKPEDIALHPRGRVPLALLPKGFHTEKGFQPEKTLLSRSTTHRRKGRFTDRSCYVTIVTSRALAGRPTLQSCVTGVMAGPTTKGGETLGSKGTSSETYQVRRTSVRGAEVRRDVFRNIPGT